MVSRYQQRGFVRLRRKYIGMFVYAVVLRGSGSTNNQLSRVISDGARAYEATVTEAPLRSESDRLARVLQRTPPLPVSPFVIMSAEGTWHPAHFDPSGFGTMLHVLRGRKAALIAVPQESHVPIPPHVDTHWDLINRPHMNVYFFVVKANETL